MTRPERRQLIATITAALSKKEAAIAAQQPGITRLRATLKRLKAGKAR